MVCVGWQTDKNEENRHWQGHSSLIWWFVVYCLKFLFFLNDSYLHTNIHTNTPTQHSNSPPPHPAPAFCGGASEQSLKHTMHSLARSLAAAPAGSHSQVKASSSSSSLAGAADAGVARRRHNSTHQQRHHTCCHAIDPLLELAVTDPAALQVRREASEGVWRSVCVPQLKGACVPQTVPRRGRTLTTSANQPLHTYTIVLLLLCRMSSSVAL